MSISDIGPILLTCMFTSISSEGPEGRFSGLHDAAVLIRLTPEVWSVETVVVKKEIVEKLADVVGGLVGDQAAGDLVVRTILPSSGLAENITPHISNSLSLNK